MSLRGLTLAVVTLSAMACASPAPRTPSPGPTLTSPPAPLASPSPTPTPTPSLPIDTPSPAGVQVGALAMVAVDKLTQSADPSNPKDHAWQSPCGWGCSTLQTLGRGEVVYVLDQTHVGDAGFWKIAAGKYVGCCAPFGWVAERREGSQSLDPYTAACLSGPDLSVQEFETLGAFDGLACFGSSDVTIEGQLTCGQPIADAGAFLVSPWNPEPERSWFCDLHDNTSDIDIGLTGDVFETLASGAAGARGNGQVTGHFDDPRSNQCRWGVGDMGNFVPDDGGPTETAVFACRLQFVPTAVHVA